MELNYIIEEKYKNETLNTIIKTEFKISSRLLSKLIKNNCIFINNQPFKTNSIANVGNLLTIKFDYQEDNSNIVSTNIPLDIIYEDDWMLVVNKPPYTPIHPSRLHFDDSLSNQVKAYYDKINLHKKIRPVNRLDLNTSGIVIFAKCEYIQECFIKQMQTNQFEKHYLCAVSGHLQEKCGEINFPISRKENSIIERCVNERRKTFLYKICCS